MNMVHVKIHFIHEIHWGFSNENNEIMNPIHCLFLTRSSYKSLFGIEMVTIFYHTV